MYTIVETPTFKHDVDKIWSLDERGDFYTWLAAKPDAKDVIPSSGGFRKYDGQSVVSENAVV